MKKTLEATYTCDSDTAPHKHTKGSSNKNHSRMDSIHYAPQKRQGNFCNLFKVQVSNDIRRENMDTHQPDKEQATSRSNKDIAYHLLDTLQRETIYRKASETMERRTILVMEGYHLAEDHIRQPYLETAS